MKKLSIYSAIILCILGLYSFSTFSKDDNRAPSAALTIKGRNGVTKKIIPNANLCKDDDDPMMSVGSFYEEAEKFIKFFKEKFGNDKDKLKQLGIEAPKIETDYNYDFKKINLKLKGFPACVNAFNDVGGRLPSGPGITESNVYIPYLGLDRNVLKKCLDRKVPCIFDRIFGDRNTAEFINKNFTPKKFMKDCFDKFKKNVEKSMRKGDNLSSLFAPEKNIEFVNYDSSSQLLISTKDLDSVGSDIENRAGTSRKYCPNSNSNYEIAKFADVNSDGTRSIDTSLYDGVGCKGEIRGGELISANALQNIQNILLFLEDKNEKKSVIKDGGNGSGDFKLAGGPDDYNGFQCGDQDISKFEGKEKVFETRNDYKTFLNRLRTNTRIRYNKYENDIKTGNSSGLKDLQEHFNGDAPPYNVNMLFGVAKRIALSPSYNESDKKDIWNQYAKIKEMELVSKSPNSPKNEKIKALRKLKKEKNEFLACKGVGSILEGDKCTYTFVKTVRLLDYLKNKREALEREESSSLVDTVASFFTEEESEESTGDVGETVGAETLIDSTETLGSPPYSLSDLDKRISFLERRVQYLKRSDIKDINMHCEEKMRDQEFNFDEEEKEFFANLKGATEKVADNDEETEDEEKDDENDELRKRMEELQMLVAAQGNQQYAGMMNGYGGSNQMLYALEQRMNGLNSMFYQGLATNYQSSLGMMNFMQGMENNNYQMYNSLMDFSLQNSMLSNQFNYMTPMMYYPQGTFFNQTPGFNSFTSPLPSLTGAASSI